MDILRKQTCGFVNHEPMVCSPLDEVSVEALYVEKEPPALIQSEYQKEQKLHLETGLGWLCWD